MSFRSVQQNTVENTDSLSIPPAQAARGAGAGWVRNPSWTALPSITSSEEKFVGLYAVYPNSTFAAVNFVTSTGTYTVNWGDGTAPQTYTSNVQANYTYDYTAAGLANTNAPVTFTDAGDLVNRSNHGYTNGMQISFNSITTTTGISAGQIYYVVNATTNTFQLSATPFGSVLPLTNDGSGIILPYKLAVITVTPTTSGATFTQIDLNKRNTATSIVYSTGWLDIAMASSATGVFISATGGSVNVLHSLLQQARILRHRDTTLNDWFANCVSLQNVVEITADTGINITSTNQTFYGCRSLVTAPFFNTSTVTNMALMFYACNSLVNVPLYNTGAVTGSAADNTSGMAQMFVQCYSLKTIPLFNTANVVNMRAMFANCQSLETVPLLNTSSVTGTSISSQGGLSAMFTGCVNLKTVPQFNTANCVNFAAMFQGCSALTTVPLFNTANALSVAQMFQNCTALQSVPLFNTASVVGDSSGANPDQGFNNMFNGCSSLTTVPLFNMSNCIGAFSMFNGCTALQSIPPFNTSKLGNASGMFTSCTGLQSLPALDFSKIGPGFFSSAIASFASLSSLSKCSITGINSSVTFASCKLSGAALDEIYTNLLTIIPASGAVTFQGGGANTVTYNNHGMQNFQVIRFSAITTTTGISINTDYYVRNVTTNTFQLSLISGSLTGTIITLTNNGTGTVSGYTITVTGNYGTATDTPTIATNKGWTVTGS